LDYATGNLFEDAIYSDMYDEKGILKEQVKSDAIRSIESKFEPHSAQTISKYDDADLEDFAKNSKFKTTQSNTYTFFNIDEDTQIRITKDVGKSGKSEGYRVTLHKKAADGIFGNYIKSEKAHSLQEAKKEAAKIYFDEIRKEVSSSADISDAQIDYSKVTTDELKRLGEKTNDFSQMAAIKKELESRN
jgi:hypothetical protein